MPATTPAPFCLGIVLFCDDYPTHFENFQQLSTGLIKTNIKPATPKTWWNIEVTHPDWGTAQISCPRDFTPVPPALVKFDPRLTDRERRLAESARNAIAVTVPQNAALRDRKILLRFLYLLMGNEGLLVADKASFKFWSRDALAEELTHNADLDIESVFAAHSIYSEVGEKKSTPYWLHTHGLSEIGTLDFDILRPSPAFNGNAWDVVRGVAYILLDKGPALAGHSMRVVHPGDPLAFVPIEHFNQNAQFSDKELRGDPDDLVHNTDRVILCDPSTAASSPIPSPCLSQLDGDRMMIMFPSSATAQMSARARGTFQLYRSLPAEFAEFQVKPIAKIGCPIEGRPNDREHMWFEVNAIGEDFVDATLCNQPRQIPSMKPGDRRNHPLENLTDWAVVTPVGQITPRNMFPARILRLRGDEIREKLKQQKK